VYTGIYDADNVYCSEDFLNKFHKEGIDANNGNMIYQVSETNKRTVITKKYYNEISHITKNLKIMNEKIKENGMTEIYEKMTEINKNTVDINEYKKYIEIIRDNRSKIWNFYSKKEILHLKYDSYINKKKAIGVIIKTLIPEVIKKEREKKYCHYIRRIEI